MGLPPPATYVTKVNHTHDLMVNFAEFIATARKQLMMANDTFHQNFLNVPQNFSQ